MEQLADASRQQKDVEHSLSRAKEQASAFETQLAEKDKALLASSGREEKLAASLSMAEADAKAFREQLDSLESPDARIAKLQKDNRVLE